MNKFLLFLIILVIIFSTQHFNHLFRKEFTPLLSLLVIYLSINNNSHIACLLTVIIILNLNKNNINIDTFGNYVKNNRNKVVQTRHCVPSKNGKCPYPLNPSINSDSWCCMGNCYCNQPCPPTTCEKKYSWGGCPNKGQVISADDPNMCCYGKGCKCKKDPTCPNETMCGAEVEEEEEEEEEETTCPCNPDLVCKPVKDKIIPRKVVKYTAPPPSICQKYINKKNKTQNTNRKHLEYSSKVPVPPYNTVSAHKVLNMKQLNPGPLDPFSRKSTKFWEERSQLPHEGELQKFFNN